MIFKNLQGISTIIHFRETFASAIEWIARNVVGLLGIKFAPLLVPLDRRLQTLAAFGWISIWTYLGTLGYIILISLIRSDYYLIAIFYFMTMMRSIDISHKGGNRKTWWCKCSFFSYLRDYFPIKLVKTEELDPQKNYLAIAYPHGLMTVGCFACFGSDACGFGTMFSGLTSHMLTLKGNFVFPIMRELFLWSGLCDVSAESIDFLTNPKNGKGKFVVVLVGGSAESLNAHANTGEHRIVLKNRKGFIKAAMKHGTSLVPIFDFGEIDIYHQVNNPRGSTLRKWQDWLRVRLGTAPVLFYARGFFQYSFGFIPFRRPITVVVGKHIEVIKNSEPTQEEVDNLHQKFTQSLIELFEDGKHKYISDPEKSKLIIE